MPDASDILWFKTEFTPNIEAAIKNTPFTVDMLAAIACQETGYLWSPLRKKNLGTARILELCVGDTIDAPGRSAFPKTKSELISKVNGDRMFQIARKGLEDMAQETGNADYLKIARNKPDKFCHGFGIFQYDLQFFLKDASHFLGKDYANFDKCLGKCLDELRRGLKKVGLQGKPTLTDLEMASVAIAYNTGGFKPSKGLKQGHFDGKKFYGEQFFDFLRLSKTVAVPGGGAPVLATPPPGSAVVAPPTPVTAQGALFEVDVRQSPLRMRSEPKISSPDANANVIAHLPDGQLVQAVTKHEVDGFREVQTNLQGAHFHGYVSTKFLIPARGATAIPVTTPSTGPAPGGIAAVLMPRKAGTITKRTDKAGAHSLNEPGQPGRHGTTADELRGELAEIVDWLAVDDPAHLRYQPTSKTTFCNIYLHDYCHLAGVYLPRVWWTQGAIVDLAQGKPVQPLYGNTIDEQRANDLFRWLRDFGSGFGWRRTGTLTKLQTEVNQGAIGLIVARRTNDGLSGHIVAVVPETNTQQAKRDAAGEVVTPLQSQAGATNFRYGIGKRDWWKGSQFAESAFWLHA